MRGAAEASDGAMETTEMVQSYDGVDLLRLHIGLTRPTPRRRRVRQGMKREDYGGLHGG